MTTPTNAIATFYGSRGRSIVARLFATAFGKAVPQFVGNRAVRRKIVDDRQPDCTAGRGERISELVITEDVGRHVVLISSILARKPVGMHRPNHSASASIAQHDERRHNPKRAYGKKLQGRSNRPARRQSGVL